MDTKKINKQIKEFTKKVIKQFPVRKIVLYGSYANGFPRKDSDIDIGIFLENNDADYLMTATKLYRICQDIDPRIEPILLDETNDNSGFAEDVLKNGKLIYASK